MKNLKLIVLSILLIGLQTTLHSQLGIIKKRKIKKTPIHLRSNQTIHFGMGTGGSFHYGAPVYIREFSPLSGLYYDDIQQSPGKCLHVNIALNTKIYTRHDLFFDLGFTEHTFKENGVIKFLPNVIPDPTFSDPYSHTLNLNYFNFSVGHRYTFFKKINLSAFAANQIIHDWHLKSKSIRTQDIHAKSGFSYKINIGLEAINHTNRKVLLSLYFKTAFVRYNHRRINKDFYPFSFGFNTEIAFAFKKMKNKR